MTVAAGAAARHNRALRPVALITGGSRGIGHALAHGFAARGRDVVLVARDKERLQLAAGAIASAHRVSADHFVCDLTEPNAAAELLTAVANAGCYVDILVNCAGIGASGDFGTSGSAETHQALRLNIDATTALMQRCLPGMVARGRGGVLNVASLVGVLPMPYFALYGATKSYLVALSRAVAAEVAGSGVTVSVLVPGPVDTGFFARNMQADEERISVIPGLSPASVARTAIDGFFARQTVITPGMLGWLCRLGAKLLPHRLSSAIVRPILKPRHPVRHADLQPAASDGRPAQARPPAASVGLPPPRVAVRGHMLVLACIAAVFALQVGLGSRKAAFLDTDPGSNAAAAAGLLEYGLFAKAFVAPGSGRPIPGRELAPGYPAFIAGVAVFDRGLREAVNCLVAKQGDCVRGNPFRTLIAVQALLALLALVLVVRVAFELSGSSEIAGLAALLTFVMGRFGDLVLAVTPYAILPSMALIFYALLCIAHRRRSLLAAAAAGLLLGLLALTEVYYAALIAVAPLLLVLAEASRRVPGWRFALGAGGLLALAAGLVLGAWMARSYVLFGDAAPVKGSAAKALAERMVYTGLSGRELLAALCLWLPGLGDLANLFLPADSIRKFDVYYKGSLLLESERLLDATPATDSESQFRRLLDVYALGNPAEYAVMTTMLIMRGLRSSGSLVVLWGWVAVPLLLRRLRAQGELAGFLLIAGPMLAVTFVQSLLSANLPWMNVPLVFVYAYAIASVTGGLELPFGLRRLFGRQREAETASRGA